MRMADEAFTLLVASGDTVARTLTTAIYHLHANPAHLQRLQEELETVMPEAQGNIDIKTLEGLPWLVRLHLHQ